MAYLAISIFSSTAIFIIFKWFDHFKVNNLYAIITNYIVAGSLGYALTTNKLSLAEVGEVSWLLPTIGIGFLFISLFQVMAYTAQKIGVSRVSIAVKMSVVLPVIAGVWLYKEQLSIVVISGIILALLAVYLGTKKPATAVGNKKNKLLLALPIVLFFGNGSIDVLLKYAQHFWLDAQELATFSGLLFFFAFLWGIVFGIIQILRKGIFPTAKDIIAGVVLGVPNFGSIYFLLKALDSSTLPSAAIYPINNVAIVGLSAIAGVFMFKEHLSRINLIGLFSAIMSIILIAYG
jgi:multidrug transporter EmrE-like cation transporter